MPCGECTACCTSSQFIHIAPDEVETISRIPSELLFPAPGLPKGNVVMGYDERGHCPMFVNQRCSIYDHRPRTCRTYDCRVLAAAGLDFDDDTKARISERVRRWRFGSPAALDHTLQAAVQAAVTFLQDHAHDLPDGAVPRSPSQLAFLAVEIHDLFVERAAAPGGVGLASPSLDAVEAAVLRAKATS